MELYVKGNLIGRKMTEREVNVCERCAASFTT